MAKITVKDTEVTVIKVGDEDYICITDMAKAKEDSARAADIIKNWLRNRTTLEFLGTWEILYNPNFKVVEFDHFKMEAGLHTFVLSASTWIEKTRAIGLCVKNGRYGGTYAHKDIAFEYKSSFQTLSLKRIPTSQSRRASPIRLECQTRTVKDQLPYSYRCHQAKPNSSGINTVASLSLFLSIASV